MVFSIIVFLFSLTLLITLHELGHFWAARLAQVKICRFSIGLGRPVLLHKASDDTEYALGWLPLGGYVHLLDGREQADPLEESQRVFAFDQKPLSKRVAIVCAGPAMNILLAVFAYCFVFLVGIEHIKPVIGQVLPGSLAAQSGLKKGGQIVSIDSQAVHRWQDIVIALVGRLGEKGTLTISVKYPSHQTQTYSLTIDDWTIDSRQPNLLKSLGIQAFYPYVPPVIQSVRPNEPADLAGLKAGDRILAVNGVSISDWKTLNQFIRKHPKTQLTLRILRSGQLKTVRVFTERSLGAGWRFYGSLGIESQAVVWPKALKYIQQYPFPNALLEAIKKTSRLMVFNFNIVGKILLGRIGLNSLGGPISLFKVARQVSYQGILRYITFLAFISIMLGCVNILPIPALDGGHLVFLLFEAIWGRQPSQAVQLLATRLGIIFLITLMVHASINDILRL